MNYFSRVYANRQHSLNKELVLNQKIEKNKTNNGAGLKQIICIKPQGKISAEKSAQFWANLFGKYSLMKNLANVPVFGGVLRTNAKNRPICFSKIWRKIRNFSSCECPLMASIIDFLVTVFILEFLGREKALDFDFGIPEPFPMD